MHSVINASLKRSWAWLLSTEPVCSHARQIVVGGKPLLRNVARHYFAVNKPKGYLCASSAAPDAVGARKLVTDLFAVRPNLLWLHTSLQSLVFQFGFYAFLCFLCGNTGRVLFN